MDEELKKKYFDKCKLNIARYNKLQIIYIRVSTDKQEELDQIKDIVRTFNLTPKECILVKAKESAFQIDKQDKRKFNIIKDIIEEFKVIDKEVFFWDLDRIYRRRLLQVEFFQYASKNNCKIFSYRQKFLHNIKSMGGDFGDVMYEFMISIFGYLAEEESKKRGDRLKKSLTPVGTRLVTNKKRLFGNKLKDSKGKKIKLNAEQITTLEKTINELINKGYTYRNIQKLLLEKKDIKVSVGYLTKIKKKYL